MKKILLLVALMLLNGCLMHPDGTITFPVVVASYNDNYERVYYDDNYDDRPPVNTRWVRRENMIPYHGGFRKEVWWERVVVPYNSNTFRAYEGRRNYGRYYDQRHDHHRYEDCHDKAEHGRWGRRR